MIDDGSAALTQLLPLVPGPSMEAWDDRGGNEGLA